MKFVNVAAPVDAVWSSPFVRWQGSLADISSLDLAAAVTTRALGDRSIDPTVVDELVLGITIPQPGSFFGTPTLAARIGIPGASGPMIAQACATSVRGSVSQLTISGGNCAVRGPKVQIERVSFLRFVRSGRSSVHSDT